METKNLEDKIFNNEPNFNNVLIMWIFVWLGIFTGGFFSIVAVIWAYVSRDFDKSWKENTHFNYFIRTFWWSLLWFCVGILTLIIFIGFIILLILTIWYIVIAVKGTILAIDQKPIILED